MFAHHDRREIVKSLTGGSALDEASQHVLRQLGYQHPNPAQVLGIQSIAHHSQSCFIGPDTAVKNSVLLVTLYNSINAIFRDGGGKTSAKPKTASPRIVVIVPSSPCADQILALTQRVETPHDVNAAVLTGGSGGDKDLTALKENPSVVFASPAILLDYCDRSKVDLSQLRILLFYDFAQLDQQHLRALVSQLVRKPSLKIAWLTTKASHSAFECLHVIEGVTHVVDASAAAKEVIADHSLSVILPHTFEATLRSLASVNGSKVIVAQAGESFERARSVIHTLGRPKRVIHDRMTLTDRSAAIEEFISGRCNILLTDDVRHLTPNIRTPKFLINCDAPTIPNDYTALTQMFEQSGSHGGRIITLVTPQELSQAEAVLKLCHVTYTFYDKPTVTPASLSSSEASVLACACEVLSYRFSSPQPLFDALSLRNTRSNVAEHFELLGIAAVRLGLLDAARVCGLDEQHEVTERMVRLAHTDIRVIAAGLLRRSYSTSSDRNILGSGTTECSNVLFRMIGAMFIDGGLEPTYGFIRSHLTQIYPVIKGWRGERPKLPIIRQRIGVELRSKLEQALDHKFSETSWLDLAVERTTKPYGSQMFLKICSLATDLAAFNYLLNSSPYKPQGTILESRRSLLAELTPREGTGLRSACNAISAYTGLSVSHANDVANLLLGAVFLDSGVRAASRSLVVLQDQRHQSKPTSTPSVSRTVQTDPRNTTNFKAHLALHCAMQQNPMPRYKSERIGDQFLATAILSREVVGQGLGLTQDSAENAAARAACMRMGI